MLARLHQPAAAVESRVDRGKVLTEGTEDADSRLLRCAVRGRGHSVAAPCSAPLQAAQLVN